MDKKAPENGDQAPTRSLHLELDNRIAKLLHDDLLQTFGACVLKLQFCQKLVEKEHYDKLGRELASLEDSLNSAIDSVRDIMAKLTDAPTVE